MVVAYPNADNEGEMAPHGGRSGSPEKGGGKGSGGAGEEDELQQLKDLFSGARQSPLSVGVYYRYLATQENRGLAEQERQRKIERDRVRSEAMRERYEHTQARRAETQRIKAEKVAQRAVTSRNWQSGKAVREEYQDGQQRFSKVRTMQLEVVHQRTQEAHDYDARLDAIEAKDAEARREVHSRDNSERRARLQKRLEAEKKMLREQAGQIKTEVTSALRGALSDRDFSKKKQAEEKRQVRSRRQRAGKGAGRERLPATLANVHCT